MFSFWNNPKKKNREKIIVDENGVEATEIPPKHTGGKKPYIMVMQEEVERLRSEGVKGVEELIGYCVSMGKYIEWNTGKLIHKRSKKPLKYSDLLDIYKCSNNKLSRMISEMKEHDLLYKTEEGYFISSRLLKKGKGKG